MSEQQLQFKVTLPYECKEGFKAFLADYAVSHKCTSNGEHHVHVVRPDYDIKKKKPFEQLIANFNKWCMVQVITFGDQSKLIKKQHDTITVLQQEVDKWNKKYELDTTDLFAVVNKVKEEKKEVLKATETQQQTIDRLTSELDEARNINTRLSNVIGRVREYTKGHEGKRGRQIQDILNQ